MHAAHFSVGNNFITTGPLIFHMCIPLGKKSFSNIQKIMTLTFDLLLI